MKKDEKAMYKILEENVMLRQADRWISTSAVLSPTSGGKRVDFINEDGIIIKSQPFCRSPYGNVTKEGDGFADAEIPEKSSFSDPDFYAKQLRELGLKDVKNSRKRKSPI